MHLACDPGALGGCRELSLLVAFDQELAGTADHRLDVALAAADVHADEGSDEGEDELTEDAVQRDLECDGSGQLEEQRDQRQ